MGDTVEPLCVEVTGKVADVLQRWSPSYLMIQQMTETVGKMDSFLSKSENVAESTSVAIDIGTKFW